MSSAASPRPASGRAIILAAVIVGASLVLFAAIRAVSRLTYDDCVVTESVEADGSRTRIEECS